MILMSRYHIILTCGGLTETEAATAPAAIANEFGHRPWHQNVTCRWDGRLIWLEADNDYDVDGTALLEEFRDVITACVNASGKIHFGIVSVAMEKERRPSR